MSMSAAGVQAFTHYFSSLKQLNNLEITVVQCEHSIQRLLSGAFAASYADDLTTLFEADVDVVHVDSALAVFAAVK